MFSLETEVEVMGTEEQECPLFGGRRRSMALEQSLYTIKAGPVAGRKT